MVKARLLVPLACFATAAVVSVVAIVDHHLKQRKIDDAQVADYFCRTEHKQCGGESWHRLEDRWQSRQIVYETVVIVLAGCGSAVLGYRLVRR